MTGSLTSLEELLADTGSDAWVNTMTPPGLPNDLALILQNPQGTNLDFETIQLLSDSGVYDAHSFISLKSLSLSYLAPFLTPNFCKLPAPGFAMPNCMAATLWNNNWFKRMAPSTLTFLIGMPTTHIGAAIAVKLGSPSMLPTTLRQRPATRTC